MNAFMYKDKPYVALCLYNILTFKGREGMHWRERNRKIYFSEYNTFDIFYFCPCEHFI